jgi:hypothetical protein
MSNYWDLGCITCDEKLEIHANHGAEAILTLVAAAPHIARLGTACPVAEISLASFNIYAERATLVSAQWFAKHSGHELSPKSEYGYYYKECSDSVRCGSCGTSLKCVLLKDHEGLHNGGKQ